MSQILVLFVFFMIYSALYKAGLLKYNKELSLLDVFHFTVVSQSSIGYGDVYPENNLAKTLTWIHILTAFSLAAFS